MTEQRINGQMGHPAACMMESKSGLQSGAAGSCGAKQSGDYVSGVVSSRRYSPQPRTLSVSNGALLRAQILWITL